MADEEKLRQYLKKVMAELQQSRRQLAAVTAKDREPIAIVGIGCRFPGGINSPQELWELVDAGEDVIGAIPQDRGWRIDERLGRLAGGFLSDVACFDPHFFGISGSEARAMDPQQRLLLETAWEAIERAGIDPATLHGSRTGVYTGLTFTGYPMVLGGAAPPEEVLDFMGVGSSSGVAAGRIAYLLGLLGPAMTVDTACSSSLVALHLACQGLRRGECTMALAGGASICALPNLFMEFERRGTISADGRSKSFAAAADGVSFGEGVGVLLLERLSDARENGHPIFALIRGSAVNQDGATNGLAAPSGQAQERVIRQALADAGLTPDQVDAVEGHGVGAAVADGIEAQALIETYGRGRPADRPLRLGSVKSNIGHAQAAGGVAGVIKTVMAMRNGRLPATLHVDAPSRHADWSTGSVRLLTTPQPWLPGERPRRAGVSCFSISGTNSHLLLEEAPSPTDHEMPDVRPDGAVAWVISGKSDGALRDQGGRLRRLVAAGADLWDVGYSLAVTRSRFKHRALIVAETPAEVLSALDALETGTCAPGLTRAVADGGGKDALVFPASEECWRPGAGEGLYRAFDVFASAYDEVSGLTGAADTGGEVDRDRATFALQVALWRLAEAFGFAADHVVGEGIGELSAAVAARVLTLAEAAELFVARRRLAAGGTPDEYRKVVADLAFGAPEVPVVSASAGGLVTAAELGRAEHWADMARSGRLAAALRCARDAGVTRCLSLGARGLPEVKSMGRPERPWSAVAALDEEVPEGRSWLTAIGALHAAGSAVDWSAAFDGSGARRIELPTYPFQHRRYWLTPLPDMDDVDGEAEDVELIPAFAQRRLGLFQAAQPGPTG